MGWTTPVHDAGHRALFVLTTGGSHLLFPAIVAAWALVARREAWPLLFVPPVLGTIALALLATVWKGLFCPWKTVHPINWSLPIVQTCASFFGAHVVQGVLPPVYRPGDPPFVRADLLWARPDWLATVCLVQIFALSWATKRSKEAAAQS